MLLREQRELVVEYGKKLVTTGLTDGTFGNLSVFDRESGLMAISPSGMDYFLTTPEDVVVTDLDGKAVDVNTIKSLAALPSREVLLAKLLGSMTNAIGGFVRVVEAYRKQKAGE